MFGKWTKSMRSDLGTIHHFLIHTVDGRNPKQPGMYKTTSWYAKYSHYWQGFYTSEGGCLGFLPSTISRPQKDHHLDTSLVPGSKSKFEAYIDFLWQRDWGRGGVKPNFLEWRYVETWTSTWRSKCIYLQRWYPGRLTWNLQITHLKRKMLPNPYDYVPC